MNKKPIVCGIVAVGPDNVIGRDGRMPWYSKQDFWHFRTITTPYPCVFGKTTYEGMSKKTLPNRLNIVCSSQYKNEYVNGVFYANSVESALNQCVNFDKVFICGGGAIYSYVLNRDMIDVMYITKLKDANLTQKIKAEPNEYSRFPMDISEFFCAPKWSAAQIKYAPNLLPTEQGAITAEFFKCIRVR